MESTILLPEPIQAQALTLAQQLGISVNDLCTEAIVAYLHKHDRRVMLTQLNEVYSAEDVALDPAIAAIQYASLPREDW
jgi:hypothetical protein